MDRKEKPKVSQEGKQMTTIKDTVLIGLIAIPLCLWSTDVLASAMYGAHTVATTHIQHTPEDVLKDIHDEMFLNGRRLKLGGQYVISIT